MPRSKRLSKFEKGQILVLYYNCWSISAIARELDRWPGVCGILSMRRKGLEQKHPGGRPPKIGKAEKQRILQEASKGMLGSANIFKALQLNLTPRYVRQVPQRTTLLQHKNIYRTPATKDHHKKVRNAWARQRMAWSMGKWKTIICSDEKKFNPDGPDCPAFKWHDLQKEKEWLSKRLSGGWKCNGLRLLCREQKQVR